MAIEDYQLQSMPDCSPPKWHLAHTSWFFETFILAEFEKGFHPFHPQFNYLFNSYYEAVGERWPRHSRGLLSRPTVAEVYAYRRAVDERMSSLFGSSVSASFASLVELGLNHEQQHQELLLTDLKHAFAMNPLRPVYSQAPLPQARELPKLTWKNVTEGVHSVGHTGEVFAFDNESPRHKVYLNGFDIAPWPVTVVEYAEFVDAGGYEQPAYWLSDGWAVRKKLGWIAPLYWQREGDGWQAFTLNGTRPIDPNDVVNHVSFYEADAYARWAGVRLPTEAEWEVACEESTGQWFGNVWQWTNSPYSPYPGYRPATGGLGEYNGKFMCNQMVLRGSSSATPEGHSSPTYRNFFPPDARWQFSGFRLARDLSP